MSILRTTQFICLLAGFLSAGLTHGQRDQLRSKEDSLKELSISIRNARGDSARNFLNSGFLQTLNRALMLKDSYDYPFDSLKTVSRILSPDKKLRIFTWNLPNDDGTHRYFGFILLNPRQKVKEHLYMLTDRSDSIRDPGTIMLDAHSWYGCLYYSVVYISVHGKDYYTLLGWDALSKQISQKIIEILTVDPAEGVVFGAKIFRNYGAGQDYRIFFKYSSTTSMVLKYDKQFLKGEKRWNAKNMQFETALIPSEMIVCDDLVPLADQFKGNYEYYLPSGETFHGFVFQEGMWIFYPDVEVRNQDK